MKLYRLIQTVEQSVKVCLRDSRRWVVALAPCVLLLASCATSPSRVDKGPLKAGTFCFVRNDVRPNVAFADNRKQMHSMIQDAIAKSLTAKGLSETQDGADLTVAYLVIVGDNVSTMAIGEYFGYGRDSDALEDRAYDAYTGSKNPNTFEAGTLLIDILDSKTFKLLSRDFVVKPILRNTSAEVRAERIQEAVDEALKSVQIVR
jgi:hypothetical protein